MHHKARNIFYGLAIFVLMNGLFVMGGVGEVGEVREVRGFRQEVSSEFTKAFVQTIGDQPVLDELELVWRGISDFYDQSTEAMVALLDPKGADDDVIAVGKKVYLSFAQAINNAKNAKSYANDANGRAAGEHINQNFMTEEPIYNIVPEGRR